MDKDEVVRWVAMTIIILGVMITAATCVVKVNANCAAQGMENGPATCLKDSK